MFDQEGYTRPNVYASDHSTAVGGDLYIRTVAPKFCNACRMRHVHDHENICPQCSHLRNEAQGQALMVYAVAGWMACTFVVINLAAFLGLQLRLIDLATYSVVLEVFIFLGYLYFGPKVSAWLTSFDRRTT